MSVLTRKNLAARIVKQEGNVISLNFDPGPDGPAPRFPGAAGLRDPCPSDDNAATWQIAGPVTCDSVPKSSENWGRAEAVRVTGENGQFMDVKQMREI